MGILDFREICSANSTHESVKNSDVGKSNLPDDFELFCQEFFTQVKRFKIFRSVSNGPDLGIDLGVEEYTRNGPIRWLVSCKHYAHSDKYIPENVELNIVEKVGSWKCDGFIPFYTTVPSTSLSQVILGAESFIKVERYYKDRIERELLDSALGTSIASRYFPKSIINHYRNFVIKSTEYSLENLKIEKNLVNIRGLTYNLPNDGKHHEAALDRLIEVANVMAGFEKHEPYFKIALDDAISLYPKMFTCKKNTKNPSSYDYEPSWKPHDIFELANKYGLGKAYFISSVWSFWDEKKANDCFADFMIIWSSPELQIKENFETYKAGSEYSDHHLNVIKRSLLLPGFLGIKLQDNERDIVARLFAYCNPIPKN